LDLQLPTIVKEIVSARTDGATPLVVACRNGHFEVAQYLIEKCHADLEQTGSGEPELSEVKTLSNNTIPSSLAYFRTRIFLGLWIYKVIF
jgi:hypothetical protein